MKIQSFEKELSKHVPEALRRMNRIVESLVDYARPKYPQKIAFDVETFINSVAVIISPTLKRKRFTYLLILNRVCVFTVIPIKLNKLC